MDPALERLARERFGSLPEAGVEVPEGGDPQVDDGYVHTLLASPKGRDCVTYQALGEGHVARQECPCRPNLVHCGDERVWLHQRPDDEGVKIGEDVP